MLGKAGKIEAHHENYDKPLEVVWLCKDCHGLTRRKRDFLIAAAPELLEAAEYVESMAQGLKLPDCLNEAIERLWLAAQKARRGTP